MSPLYDVNPDIYGENLLLNVDDNDSSIDFDLAVAASPYYDVSPKQANELVAEIKYIVDHNWRKAAKKYGISRGEIERMGPAFEICEKRKNIDITANSVYTMYIPNRRYSYAGTGQNMGK